MHFHLPQEFSAHCFFEGVRKGIWLYAWSKDGEQYVGTCGRTLKEAIAEIDKQEQKHRLAEEIFKFLTAHGNRNALTDQGTLEVTEEPKEWSSPDALEMERSARELKKGNVHVPHSSWESGGYHPNWSKLGRKWHDKIWKTLAEMEK